MRTKFIALVGLSLAVLGAFQNCGSGNLPDTGVTAASVTVPPDMVLGTLVVVADKTSVSANTTVKFTATMTNLTSANYTCTTEDGTELKKGMLTPVDLSFSLKIPKKTQCIFEGVGVNLVAAVSSVVSVGIKAPVTTTPSPAPVVVAPAQTWTWRGLVVQTTCNRKNNLCDGVEWASCVGTACRAPKIQCYNATPRGVSGHNIGATQTTEPTGEQCLLRQANEGFVWR